MTEAAKPNGVYGALAKAQAEFKPPARSGENTYLKNKYATLADIFSMALPILSAHDLCVFQTVMPNLRKNDGLLLRTTVAHEDGSYLFHDIPLGFDDNSKNAKMQVLGAAITYAKRLGVKALLAIDDGEHEDDGEALAARTAEPKLRGKAAQERMAELARNMNAARTKHDLSTIWENDVLPLKDRFSAGNWHGLEEIYAGAEEHIGSPRQAMEDEEQRQNAHMREMAG